MKLRSSLRFVYGMLAIAVLVTALPRAGEAQVLPKLRVAASAADGFAEAHYALDLGFFEKEGLSVELTTVANGNGCYRRRRVRCCRRRDHGSVKSRAAVIRGVSFTLIAGGGMYTSASPVIVMEVAKNSTLKNAVDLEGRRSASSGLNDIHARLGRDLAQRARCRRDESEVRPKCRFRAMGAALARGTVDAAVIAEPALTAARNDGQTRDFAKVLDAVAPNFLNGTWFTMAPFAQQNPEVIKRFKRQFTTPHAGRTRITISRPRF